MYVCVCVSRVVAGCVTWVPVLVLYLLELEL